MSEAVVNSTMISLEVLGMLILVILLYGTLAWNRSKDEKTKCFIACIICDLVGGCLDLPTWIIGDSSGNGILVCFLVIAALGCMYAISTSFTFYVTAVIREDAEITWKYPLSIGCLNLLLVITVVILSIAGKVVGIVDGRVTYSRLYSIFSVGGIIAIFVNIFVILRHKKTLGKRNVLALMSYGILPAIAASLMFTGLELELGFTSVTLAMLIIYVFIQSGRVSELELRTQLLTELSYIDPLTGLNSRHSYNELVENTESGKRGIAFCDLNTLKYVNDTASHHAGDQLLKRFAEILKAHFDPEELFRVSGDEFLVISSKDEETFTKAIGEFKDELHQNNDIAAVGVVYGGEDTPIKKLIAEAEKLMYEDKKKHHAAHPEFRTRYHL